MNFQVFKLGLEKAKEPEIKLPTSFGERKSKRILGKTSASLSTLMLLTVYQKKLWKILKKTEVPDHLTWLLRNLYAGQEATVRTGHGTTDWFQIRKGVCQGFILSPCLFNLYANNIKQNARLDEAQAGIKIAGKNINNLRYTDDTTPMAQNEEELKQPLDENERGE